MAIKPRRIDAAAEAAGRRPCETCGILNLAIRIDPDAQPQPDAVTGSARQVVSRLPDVLGLGFTGLTSCPAPRPGGEHAVDSRRSAPILRSAI
jgi:hypothetical protein